MRKEVFIAIGLGFALGLVITFGIWTANRAVRRQQEAGPAPSPTPLAQEAPTLALSLDSPEDGSISEEEIIALSGQSAPGTTIVIISEEEEVILTADDEGRFETEVTLAGGANDIEVTAYDNQGNQASRMLTVVYSTAEF